MKINDNFLKMQSSYLFVTIANKVTAYAAANPEADIIRLGIGDVTRPLAPAVIRAMEKATEEMATESTFRGYPSAAGEDFLLNAIRDNDFLARGIDMELDEIFVSDGAKSDCGNLGDIFSTDNIVAVCDPVYPVYVDANIMDGRAGEPLDNGQYSKIVYMPCTKENGFMPELPREKVDLIYLCFPNNPTGVSISKTELQKWVDFANENSAVIFYDAAYEAFISDEAMPRSIYEIDGAKTCAIEVRSFSKTAGFTGIRCGYTIVPKELKAGTVSLNELWARRQSTKFNGVSYITQRAAQATYSSDGKKQIQENIDYYKKNATVIFDGLKEAGLDVYGAEYSPYVWLKTPSDMTSWEFFDYLLEKVQVVGTPGSGFGNAGEGYFRLTGFGSASRTHEAVERIKNLLK